MEQTGSDQALPPNADQNVENSLVVESSEMKIDAAEEINIAWAKDNNSKEAVVASDATISVTESGTTDVTHSEQSDNETSSSKANIPVVESSLGTDCNISMECNDNASSLSVNQILVPQSTTQESNGNETTDEPSRDANIPKTDQQQDDVPMNNAAGVTMSVDQQVDDSLVISNINAQPAAENNNLNTGSLLLLAQYGSDESLNEEAATGITQNLNYREDKIKESDKDSDSDSSSSSSSSSVFVSDSSDTESEVENEDITITPKPIKAKGELEWKDLPPIEDLTISVPEEECEPIGKVFQIVDVLVVVQSFPNSPAYDVDTVLFLEGGKPLGKIFDVFGPVCEPHYCIRFNSQEHIKQRNITLDMKVYCAPKKADLTKLVFLAQLLKMKGSDSSWVNDFETPEELQDYSDDEKELAARRNKNRSGKASAAQRVDSDPEEPARKKHSAYEKKMNERNLLLSKMPNRMQVHRLTDFRAPGFAGPSTASGGQNHSPRFREFIRHRFGAVPSFSSSFSNEFIPSPRPNTNFGPNHQDMSPGQQHAFRNMMADIRSRHPPFASPPGPFMANDSQRPNFLGSPQSWNLPPNIPPMRPHPCNTPPMRMPPDNMQQIRMPPHNMPPMRMPPDHMPPMRMAPDNIPPMRMLPDNMPPMRTPSPRMPPMRIPMSNMAPIGTPPPPFSNFRDLCPWSEAFTMENNNILMQRNIIRPPSLPPPPDWTSRPH